MVDDYLCADASSWPFTEAARRALARDATQSQRDARVYCGDCRWYHASWTVWRALQLASGADLHRRFFRESLPALPQRPRVLLSGSGDNALLAATADALGNEAGAARIHVLDRCETPLVGCQHFAGEHGLRVQCHLRDILEFEHRAQFDLIVVHAFLGFFAPAQRPALFARWHELLAPGGHLLLVQRLRPGTGQAPVRFSATQIERFVESVLAAAVALPAQVSLSRAELEAGAREYARCISTHPVADDAALLSLCADAGLHIVHCRGTAARRAPDGSDGAGPTLRNHDGYVHLVARREACR